MRQHYSFICTNNKRHTIPSSFRFIHSRGASRRTRTRRSPPRENPRFADAMQNEAAKVDLQCALKRLNHLMEMELNDAHPTLSQLLENCRNSCRVKTSTIPHAGQGLFATRDMEQGTVISLYPAHQLGMDISPKGLLSVCSSKEDEIYFQQGESPFGQTSLHILNLEGSPIGGEAEFVMDINPYQPTRQAWRSQFVNDGGSVKKPTESDILDYYQETNTRRNSFHIPFGPPPLMATVATRDVKGGEEIFTSYDFLYWVSKLVSSKEILITEAIGQEADALDAALWEFASTVNLSERCQEPMKEVQNLFDEILVIGPPR